MLRPNFKAVNLIVLAASLLLSSCDKPKKLEAERLRISTERQLILDEITAYDNKTIAMGNLGSEGDASTMERNAATMLQKAAAAEKSAQEKLQKWSKIEARFNSLREKTTEYKAKNPN